MKKIAERKPTRREMAEEFAQLIGGRVVKVHRDGSVTLSVKDKPSRKRKSG